VQSDDAAGCAAPQSSSRGPNAPRAAVCKVLDLDQARRERGQSERRFADEQELARSTLQDRRRAADDDGLPSGWRPFFESEAGLDFVTRLLVVILVVFHLLGPCGLERVALFFRGMHLTKFLATSVGTLRRIEAPMLALIEVWEQAQRKRMSDGTATRDVTLLLDENFHWEQIRLCAMEMVSGFLLCEEPSDTRDGARWNAVLTASLVGLPLRVCALGADDGSGIARCGQIRKVPVGADIFHVQYPVCRAVARPMVRRIEQAQEAVAAREKERATVRTERAAYATTPHGPGRPPDWEGRERAAQARVEAAQAHVEAMRQERDAMRDSIRALSRNHHPVDLTTGERVTAAQVRERHQETAERLCEHAARATLGTRAIAAINKVFGRLDDLAAIVAWWESEASRRVRLLPVSEASAQWIEQVLIPAVYVRAYAPRGADAAVREALHELADRLATQVCAPTSPWGGWDPTLRRTVLAVAQTCVGLFPRSSSPLEGRNGHDSLCLHAHHQVSEGMRKARITLHNYVIQRDDGTTAAERLFGKKPDDLIAFLCEHIRLPGRGRFRKKKPKPSLLALAG
jgi:hypothetical protein